MADAPGLSLKLLGYRDFTRTLRGLDLGDSLKDAHHDVATAVVRQATQIGRRLGGVHAHVVNTGGVVRATREVSQATVRLGGAGRKHGPAFGAEFGSKRYAQFPDWRGNGENAGYMVFEAIRRMTRSGELADLWENAVAAELEHAFPD